MNGRLERLGLDGSRLSEFDAEMLVRFRHHGIPIGEPVEYVPQSRTLSFPVLHEQFTPASEIFDVTNEARTGARVLSYRNKVFLPAFDRAVRPGRSNFLLLGTYFDFEPLSKCIQLRQPVNRGELTAVISPGEGRAVKIEVSYQLRDLRLPSEGVEFTTSRPILQTDHSSRGTADLSVPLITPLEDSPTWVPSRVEDARTGLPPLTYRDRSSATGVSTPPEERWVGIWDVRHNPRPPANLHGPPAPPLGEQIDSLLSDQNDEDDSKVLLEVQSLLRSELSPTESDLARKMRRLGMDATDIADFIREFRKAVDHVANGTQPWKSQKHGAVVVSTLFRPAYTTSLNQSLLRVRTEGEPVLAP